MCSHIECCVLHSSCVTQILPLGHTWLKGIVIMCVSVRLSCYPSVLHDLASDLVQPICTIWNASFRDAYLPEIWKSADVTLLPKVQPPMRVEKDLCPISLTPVISKSLEWYLREWIMEIVEDLKDPYQFGSLKGCSTFALIELVHNWLGSLESHGKVLRILLLDFRKAFDRVNHAIFLSKISNKGVWLSYLLGHKRPLWS